MDSQISQVENIKVKLLLNELKNRGLQLKYHLKNSELINVYSSSKRMNVIGDIRIRSYQGSFRLQDKTDGKWKSFREFGFDINEDRFINDIINHID